MNTAPKTGFKSLAEFRRFLEAERAAGKSWRVIRDGHFPRASHTTLSAISRGRDPKTPRVLAQLGLPAYGLAPVCASCGGVHTLKRCPKAIKERRVKYYGEKGTLKANPAREYMAVCAVDNCGCLEVVHSGRRLAVKYLKESGWARRRIGWVCQRHARIKEKIR